MKHILLALELLAQLDALRPLDAGQEKRVWDKFRLDWNFHSNHLEGNSLTFGETKSLLLHNITAQGKPLKDHFEITGHNQAIHAVLDAARGEQPLTESFLRELHTLILKERYLSPAQTADGQPSSKWIEVGQYKTAPNHVLTVTGEEFRFAEPMDVPARMQKLVEDANNRRATAQDGLLLAAKLHYDFVLIHPFDDGNGRMARIVMNLVLMQYGFPPAVIKTQEKQAYFSALRQADGGQFEAFADYIAEQVCHSLRIMVDGAMGKDIAEDNDLDKEIALLSAQIAQKHGRLSTTKTKESVGYAVDTSFRPLVTGLVEQSEKFKSLYFGISIEIIFYMFDEKYPYTITLDEFENPTLAYISSETSGIRININFNQLSFNSLASNAYFWTVDLQLFEFNFSIRASNKQNISCPYGVQLKRKQIQTILDELSDQHIQHIKHITGTQ